MNISRFTLWLTVMLLSGLLVCCGQAFDKVKQQRAAVENGKMSIVCTSTMLGDLAQVLGGEHVHVTILCGPGVDPHTFAATPNDKRVLDEAQMIVYNGLFFESNLIDYLEKRQAEGAQVVCAADALSPDKIITTDGSPDPHLWNDIENWISVTEQLAARLAQYDPENQQTYLANAQSYTQQLHELASYTKTQLARIPERSRILITSHLAFAYLTRAYGIEAMALQGITTATEAAQSDIERIKQVVRERGVKAVFVETTSNEAGIKRVIQDLHHEGLPVNNAGALYTDALGEPEGEAGTYIKAFKFNIDRIVNALK